MKQNFDKVLQEYSHRGLDRSNSLPINKIPSFNVLWVPVGYNCRLHDFFPNLKNKTRIEDSLVYEAVHPLVEYADYDRVILAVDFSQKIDIGKEISKYKTKGELVITGKGEAPFYIKCVNGMDLFKK